MIGYMKRHEQYVKEMLSKELHPEQLADLSNVHNLRISWMQHERLVHLLVFLFVCLFTLLAWGLALLLPSLPSFLLAALLTVLTTAYIIHYYRLENNVQKWYELAEQIRRRRG